MKDQLNNIKIDRFFYLDEFECPCCHCVKLHLILLKKLSALRREIARPLIINSGFRCEKYNPKIKGTPKSYHLFGLAADVTVPSMSTPDLLKYAQKIKFGGIGIYNNFLHLDIRTIPEFWDYRS